MLVRDGSAMRHTQIVFDKSKFAPDILGNCLNLGSALKITGKLVEGMKAEAVEIAAEKVELLGECDLSYPLQKKRHTHNFAFQLPRHGKPRAASEKVLFVVLVLGLDGRVVADGSHLKDLAHD